MSSIKGSRAASDNFRKPPVDKRFRKGTSGNPKGRPKKIALQPGLGSFGAGIAGRLGAMALEEATRAVTVREGDKVSQIPAMQALIRTMFRAAAQGDTKAARQLLEMISQAESQRAFTTLEYLEFAMRYKAKFSPLFEQHERECIDPPDIHPHPDDIIINETTGEVTFDGPMTNEQAGAREIARKQAIELLGRYFEVEALLAKDPKNRALKREFEELQKYTEFLGNDAARTTRHQALRLIRQATTKKSPSQIRLRRGSKSNENG